MTNLTKHKKTWLFEGYKHIGVTEDVCGSRPIIVGTRLEPKFIVGYGKVDEVMEDFDLTINQIEECYWFTSLEDSNRLKTSKPKIKNNKFFNMTDEIWKETNTQSKETRGVSNITLDDLEELPVTERSTSELFSSIREKFQAAIKKQGLSDSEVREMLDRPEEDD